MDKKLEKIIDLKLDASDRDAERHGLIQYNYGQILRIHGLDLPPAVEIQFSYREKGGTTENRIGTTKDGITEVQIPDKMLKNNGTTQDYAIWVFVYVTDETSGNTVYRIKLYVDSRPAPGEIGEDPEEKRILDEAVEMVNQAADRAEAAERGASDQAAAAEQSKTDAAESAETAKKYLAETEEVKEETVKELTELSESVKTVIADGEESIAEKQTLAEKSITDHTDTEIARLDRETQASEERLTETIRTANNTAEAVENTASEARRAKESLDASVQNATEEKEAVAAATRTANTAKKNLDQSTADANVAKTALDKTIQSADDQNTSLGEKIETSKQLKTDLQTAGEKATQDIQTAGSEQLGKMQAVAEEFTADREQIATNKEDIGSLKEDIVDLQDKKITKFYASNQGENHLVDSDNGKIQDMVIYGMSEQTEYKGINLLPPDTKFKEYVEVSIPKGSFVFWTTDGTPANGGNFRFFNEDKTENMWLGIDSGTTSKVLPLSINAKYVQNLITTDFDLSKICLGIGSEPIYEPYTGGIPSPSPKYPQEIKSVGNCGSVSVKVMGKNILDIRNSRESITNSGVTYTRNADYSFTRTGTATNKAGNVWLAGEYNVVPFPDGSNVFCTLKMGVKYSITGCVLISATQTGIKVAKGINFIPKEDMYITGVRNEEFVVGKTYNDIVYPAVYVGANVLQYEPYTEQLLTLHTPTGINAIPEIANINANIMIDGQRYAADYVDADRGKFVQMVNSLTLDGDKLKFAKDSTNTYWNLPQQSAVKPSGYCALSKYFSKRSFLANSASDFIYTTKKGMVGLFETVDELNAFVAKKYKENDPVVLYYFMREPIENDLAPEEIEALKTLSTNYSVTNVSVTSDQLDGYIVFNYPISMENGWNYVKQQLGDTRDYIYDMDAKAQDIDIQSAEAYVNSEYAVALTELEA